MQSTGTLAVIICFRLFFFLAYILNLTYTSCESEAFLLVLNYFKNSIKKKVLLLYIYMGIYVTTMFYYAINYCSSE